MARFGLNLAIVGLLALAYYFAGKFGLSLALVNPSTTAVWAPTGIALAGFLVFGQSVWPGILLGAFLVNITTSGSIPASILIALGNTFEGFVGAALVNQFAGGRTAFDRASTVFRFALLAGLLATTVSATIGTTSLMVTSLAQWRDYVPIWLTWWLGDAGGALIVTPVIVLWAAKPRPRWHDGRGLEALCLLVAVTFLALAVFTRVFGLGGRHYALDFMLLPVVVWAAYRFGPREAATATLISSGIAIWGTVRGLGPFSLVPSNEALLLLQTFMCTMTIMGLGLAAVVAERHEAETSARAVNEQLTHGLHELERHSQEQAVLSEMSDLLHACLTVEEAYAVISKWAPRLFPEDAGALYVTNPSHNLLESAAAWGEPGSMQRVFTPEDCWGLRRGRLHLVDEGPASLPCPHLADARPAMSLCLPLMAQGDVLGVLHLERTAPGALTVAKQRQFESIADGLALSLANLRLRESLRQQSIRDPLTGLFNRRYLEESLERELHRAARNRSHIGVIMLDLDDFKHFNDTFGHRTGDLLLGELGRLLKSCIRGGDIACRYGGEEFVLLLPDIPLETTRDRAEHVRTAVKALRVAVQGEPIEPITASVGVAITPEHGATAEAVLQAADGALYRAKREGRDRVVVVENRRSAATLADSSTPRSI